MELANLPLWVWGAFLAFVLAMLALDLGVFHKSAHEVKLKEALTWSAVWVGFALAFNVGVYYLWDVLAPGSQIGNAEAATAWFTGYLVEKALSVDNIFVFLLVFSYFHVPSMYQHRVLFWGIIGALVFRAAFIAMGAALLERFAWTVLVFGAFLIYTGVKMIKLKDKKIEPDKNPAIRLFRKLVPVTPDYVGQSFLTRIDGRLWATPLLIALLFIELSDIVFAVDSIPAIFAITSEPFIVFTSNVFAILGLRALFFALSGLMGMLRYLGYGLAAVLVFVGGKMVYTFAQHHWLGNPDFKFPITLSLGTIVAILAVTVLASLVRPKASEAAVP